MRDAELGAGTQATAPSSAQLREEPAGGGAREAGVWGTRHVSLRCGTGRDPPRTAGGCGLAPASPTRKEGASASLSKDGRVKAPGADASKVAMQQVAADRWQVGEAGAACLRDAVS